MSKPKVLLIDIETAPLLSFHWGLFDQNISLGQIHSEWSVLSWSAKWLGNKQMMYMDQSKAKNIENDKELLQGIWKLLDEADVVIGHNSRAFDVKKLNARFLMHNMPPPSSFRQIDTLKIARKYFAMTSNKLEYLSDKLCCKYKKLKHKKFPGFELWKECLAGNPEAWKEMEKYNKHDVLALEEVYEKLIPWDSSINFDVYNDKEEHVCTCGSTSFLKRGFAYTNSSRFQRYRCNSCGKESRGKENLLSLDKRKSLKSGINR